MCDLIEDAGGSVIGKSLFPGYDALKSWKAVTLDEFKAGPLSEVDIIIYSNNFAAIMKECGPQVQTILKQTPAFAKGDVYDVYKTVYEASWGLGTDYFEGFVAEPDVALLDMISILLPSVSGAQYSRNYFRKALAPSKENMFVTKAEQCDDLNVPLFNDWTTEPCNMASPPVIIQGLDVAGTACKNAGPMYATRDNQECVCQYDASVDYFPYKVQPDYSDLWSVSYHKNYKIINDTLSNVVYYLVQCGTPAPTDMPADAVMITIPIKTIAVDSTTFFHFFDYQAQLTSIVHLASGENAVDPCVQLLVDNKEIVFTPTTKLNETQLDVLFASAYNYDKSKSHAANQDKRYTNASIIVLSADQEIDLEGKAEWVEFVSLFFNREQAASLVTDSIKARYDCHVDDVQKYLAPSSAAATGTALLLIAVSMLV